MAKRAADELPLGPLKDLLAWWRRARVKGMFIGGLAVALLGRPRTTRDIDAVVFVDEKKWAKFLEAGMKHSFEPRIDDVLEFARETRVLLVRHKPTAVDVDVSFGSLPFEEEALSRANKVKIGRLSLPVPTPEDLIIMKAVANREIDRADIAGLLAIHSQLDVERMCRWIDQFAQDLEDSQLYADFEKMLAEWRRRKR